MPFRSIAYTSSLAARRDLAILRVIRLFQKATLSTAVLSWGRSTAVTMPTSACIETTFKEGTTDVGVPGPGLGAVMSRWWGFFRFYIQRIYMPDPLLLNARRKIKASCSKYTLYYKVVRFWICENWIFRSKTGHLATLLYWVSAPVAAGLRLWYRSYIGEDLEGMLNILIEFKISSTIHLKMSFR